MGVLALVDPRVRRFVSAGSALGDAVAVLDAVLAVPSVATLVEAGDLLKH